MYRKVISCRCDSASHRRFELRSLINEASNFIFSAYWGNQQISIGKYGGSVLYNWYGYVSMVRSHHRDRNRPKHVVTIILY